VAWDRIELSLEQLRQIVEVEWDFFIFGTLAQRSACNRDTLDDIIEALPESARIVYDINLRQDFHRPEWIRKSMDRCSILKLNEDEAAYLSKALVGESLPPRETAALLARRHAIRTVIVTLGGAGACVLEEGAWSEIPAEKVDVADTVGAGDSFTAATLFALAKGWKTPEAVAFGTKMGGFVASRRGAVPEYSQSLQAEIARIAAGPKS
jgi:fructokinase